MKPYSTSKFAHIAKLIEDNENEFNKYKGWKKKIVKILEAPINHQLLRKHHYSYFLPKFYSYLKIVSTKIGNFTYFPHNS